MAKLAASVKLARQLDKIDRAIKDEIVLLVDKHGSNHVLEMPDGQPYQSVDIGGYSYDIDTVRVGWWKTDYRISIDSHGLNYSCSETEELLDVLRAIEEAFNVA